MNQDNENPSIVEGILKNLDLEENKIKIQSISLINSDERLVSFLQLIDRSLRTIFELIFNYKTKVEDELTIQYLGCRIFNSACSGLKIGLQGYYQSGFSLMRDLVETGYLIDYFTFEPSKISEWRKADNKTRSENFSPRIIRDKLDRRDNYKEANRNRIYKGFCEYAAHASFQGFILISQNNLVQIGPFFEPALIRALVEEIAMRLPVLVLYFLETFKDLPSDLFEIRLSFLKELDDINSRYMNIPKCEQIKEIEALMIYAKEKKYL